MNRREMLNWIKSEICPKLDLSQEFDIKCILDAVGKLQRNIDGIRRSERHN